MEGFFFNCSIKVVVSNNSYKKNSSEKLKSSFSNPSFLKSDTSTGVFVLKVLMCTCLNCHKRCIVCFKHQSLGECFLKLRQYVSLNFEMTWEDKIMMSILHKENREIFNENKLEDSLAWSNKNFSHRHLSLLKFSFLSVPHNVLHFLSCKWSAPPSLIPSLLIPFTQVC